MKNIVGPQIFVDNKRKTQLHKSIWVFIKIKNKNESIWESSTLHMDVFHFSPLLL